MIETKNCLSANVEKGATGLHWFNGDEKIEVTTSDTKFMTKIRKLAKVNSDIIIDYEPCEESDGFMIALIPVECIYSIHARKKITLTDERKEQLRKQMAYVRAAKNGSV